MARMVTDNSYLLFIDSSSGDFSNTLHDDADSVMDAIFSAGITEIEQYDTMEALRETIKSLEPGRDTYFGYEDGNNYSNSVCITRLVG